MRVLGVHHVALNVLDVPEAISLGAQLRSDRPDFGFPGAWLDIGSQQIHLVEATPPSSLGQHVALHITGLDEMVDEIRCLGFTVSDPLIVGNDRQSFLEDPSGNAIELHEVTSDHKA